MMYRKLLIISITALLTGCTNVNNETQITQPTFNSLHDKLINDGYNCRDNSLCTIRIMKSDVKNLDMDLYLEVDLDNKSIRCIGDSGKEFYIDKSGDFTLSYVETVPESKIVKFEDANEDELRTMFEFMKAISIATDFDIFNMSEYWYLENY